MPISNKQKYIEFISSLNISSKNKEYLLKLKPENYIGVAPKLK